MSRGRSGEIGVLVDLQRADTTTTDWPSEASPPAMRLLARIPYLGEKGLPSGQVPGSEEMLPGEHAEGKPTPLPDTSQHCESVRKYRRVDYQDAASLPIFDPNDDSSRNFSSGVAGGADAVEELQNIEILPTETGTSSENATTRGDLIGKFCELHADVVPYAGMIVTFALVMSAGLVYWLFLGPVPSPGSLQGPVGSDHVGMFSNEPRENDAGVPALTDPSKSAKTQDWKTQTRKQASNDPWHGETPEGGPAVVLGQPMPIQSTPRATRENRTNHTVTAEIPRVQYAPSVGPNNGQPNPDNRREIARQSEQNLPGQLTR